MALRSNNKALPGINGDESWELPVPATYVIDRDGRVALAAIDVDYRNRLEPRRHPGSTEVAATGMTRRATRAHVIIARHGRRPSQRAEHANDSA